MPGRDCIIGLGAVGGASCESTLTALIEKVEVIVAIVRSALIIAFREMAKALVEIVRKGVNEAIPLGTDGLQMTVLHVH